jgi:hypothetical protein
LIQINNWILNNSSRNTSFRIKTSDNKIDTIVNNNLKSIKFLNHRPTKPFEEEVDYLALGLTKEEVQQ